MDTINWYRKLHKPKWAPKESLFGKVWLVLYIIIFIVNAYVMYSYINGVISFQVALPFWANLLFNFAFTPIQFGLKNNYLALADILLILITLVVSIVSIWPFSIVVALVFVAYLVWVLIATILQASITYLNHKVVE
ncbi:MAG: TspO/MBR family protein [Candidatus Saccharibacteria bacterium]